MKLSIGIIGISGKMGKTINNLITHSSSFICIGGVRKTSTSFDSLIKADVLIDFSSPYNLKNVLRYSLQHTKPLVIGTTGYTKKDFLLIKNASKKIPILYSANYSIGIAICKNLIKKATSLTKNFFSISIEEIHHLEKKDSPSGTALAIKEEICSIAKNKKIPISSKRKKNYVGEHTVFFTNSDEKFLISHIAKKRASFAKGSLLSARYLYKKKPGLYSFEDALNIS